MKAQRLIDLVEFNKYGGNKPPVHKAPEPEPTPEPAPDQEMIAILKAREDLIKDFDVGAFTKYFGEQVGAVTCVGSIDNTPTHHVAYISKTVTWTGPNISIGMSAHAMAPWGDVFYVTTSMLYDGRKIKTKGADITSDRTLLKDPTKLFPEKWLKQVVSGKFNNRKFSKRDMEMSLKASLGAKDVSDTKRTIYQFTLGTKPFQVQVNRMTYRTIATWSFCTYVRDLSTKLPSESKIGHGWFPETQDTLKLFQDIKEKTKNMSSMDDVADVINSAIKKHKDDTSQLII